MVNFGLNSASILGIFLAVAGAGLYFLRSVRPELSRDHDIFFAAVGLLCGFILLFQGWRLDPILQFGQFLLTGAAVFFGVETIRLRGVATEQARRNTPIVDDERPVSDRVRVYRAELDQLEPYDEEEYDNRRLRGYQEPRTTRRSGYDEAARPSRSRNPQERSSGKTASRSRRPRPSTPPTERYDVDSFEEKPSSRSRRPRSDSPSENASRPSSRRRPPASAPEASSDLSASSTEYVDYQPLDDLDNGVDRNPSDRREPRGRRRGEPGNFDY